MTSSPGETMSLLSLTCSLTLSESADARDLTEVTTLSGNGSAAAWSPIVLHQLGHAGGKRNVVGCQAVRAHLIRLGSVPQQHPCHLHVPAGAGEVQGAPLVCIEHRDVDAGIDQALHLSFVPGRGCGVEVERLCLVGHCHPGALPAWRRLRQEEPLGARMLRSEAEAEEWASDLLREETAAAKKEALVRSAARPMEPPPRQ